jgi:hypothetical protein
MISHTYDETCKTSYLKLAKEQIIGPVIPQKEIQLKGITELEKPGTDVFVIRCPFILKDYELSDPPDFPEALNLYTLTNNGGIGSTTGRVFLQAKDEDNLPLVETDPNSSIAETTVGSVPNGLFADQRTEKIYFSLQDPADLAKFYIFVCNFDGTGLQQLTIIGNSTYNANVWFYDSNNQRIWYAYSIQDGAALPGRWNVFIKWFHVDTPSTVNDFYSNLNPYVGQQVLALTQDRENDLIYLVYDNIDGNDDIELFSVTYGGLFTKIKTWTGSAGDSYKGDGTYGNGKFYHGGVLSTDIYVTNIATGLDQVFVPNSNFASGQFQQGLFFDKEANQLYFTRTVNDAVWRVNENGSGQTEIARLPRQVYRISLGND